MTLLSMPQESGFVTENGSSGSVVFRDHSEVKNSAKLPGDSLWHILGGQSMFRE